MHTFRPVASSEAAGLFVRSGATYIVAMFRLPEITYPLKVNTIGKMLALETHRGAPSAGGSA